MVQDGHAEHPWSVYSTIGAKFGITGQAVYGILKRYNALWIMEQRNDMNPFNWDEEQMKEARQAFIALPFLLVLYFLISIVC